MTKKKGKLKTIFSKERSLEDLRRIKDAPKSFFSGLLQFLKEYSIIGLAIGVVVGQATKDLVDAIVKGFFMPLIELFVSSDKYENLSFTIDGVVFDIGKIIGNSLTFLIIMTILYLVIKKIMKNDNLLPKK